MNKRFILLKMLIDFVIFGIIFYKTYTHFILFSNAHSID